MVVAWVRLELDLDAFDDARFDRYLQTCRDSGFRFTTMAAVGDTADNRRALYDLNKACSADIPERGEFYAFDEYLAQRIDIATYDPEASCLLWMAAPGSAWRQRPCTTTGTRSAR